MTAPAACLLIGKWQIVEAGIEDDGYTTIEFAHHLGDEAPFKARRW